MPELPEVETTRRGLSPHLEGRRLQSIEIHQRNLRHPIPLFLENKLANQMLQRIERRAKYLLFRFERATVIAHLGMSGAFRVIREQSFPWKKHEHFRWYFDNNGILCYHDPRRFGFLDYHEALDHLPPYLAKLGPEPLSDDFSADYLYQRSRGRSAPIKNFIMEQTLVAGIGNIYACEALFLAKIRPTTPAGKIGRVRLARLVDAIKAVLSQAIAAGGTTLKDFIRTDGRPGYFAQRLEVYGRDEAPCSICQKTIRRIVISGRSTYYCASCQR
ncbi:MAG: bifunctional DNA-formamidopyrimidine glycosylase/DNA-(apurinic or apyrimidinic site) lyase [Gammaproteobacteria bacterium]|nr:MAG: bifunctional DNA-formamidopyrimidine glycosylase/DNA-(apurinic or apyrimidinic site) lyase [Gammaproteobacteria bacterium]